LRKPSHGSSSPVSHIACLGARISGSTMLWTSCMVMGIVREPQSSKSTTSPPPPSATAGPQAFSS
jgi:hypothetical protein